MTDRKEQLFESIYRTFFGKVRNFAQYYLKNTSDSENIAQEVLLAVWMNYDRLISETGSAIASYIFTVSKNKVLNHLRKNINAEVYRRKIVQKAVSNKQHSDDVIIRELDEILKKEIESLPPRCKEIFKLSRDGGLTYIQISKKLKISENTVDVQIRKALKFLRFRLKKYYEVPSHSSGF